MLGDVEDFTGRLQRVFPKGWLADTASCAAVVLSGFGVAWSAVFSLIAAVQAQTRLSTATGSFVDMFSADFFGSALPRNAGEVDASFKVRIGEELLRPRSTRPAMLTALNELVGPHVEIFEPAWPEDAGGYAAGGVGYCVAGAWGNLSLPFQSFLQVHRPLGGGIPLVAGYGTAGVLGYCSLDMNTAIVSDVDIYAAAAAILPVGYTGWVQITS